MSSERLFEASLVHLVRAVAWLVGRSVGLFVCFFVLFVCLIVFCVFLSVCLSVCLFVGWLVGWLVCLIGCFCLFVGLVGLLICFLCDWLFYLFACSPVHVFACLCDCVAVCLFRRWLVG